VPSPPDSSHCPYWSSEYVYDKGLTDREDITIVSAGKIKYLKLTVEGRTATDRGCVTLDVEILYPLHKYNGMGIAHGDTGHTVFLAVHRDRCIHYISAGKIKYLKLTVEGRTATDRGCVTLVQVNMGQPVLAPMEVPVIAEATRETPVGSAVVDAPILFFRR